MPVPRAEWVWRESLHPPCTRLDRKMHSQTPRKPPLTPEENQIAPNLFKALIDHAHERTSKGRNKPAVLISEAIHRIQCKEEFLEQFLIYISMNVLPEGERRTGLAFSEVFAHFRDFSSWNSKAKDTAMDSIDRFAEYLINSFYMSRELTVFWRDWLTMANANSIMQM